MMLRLVIALALAFPAVSRACPVCFGGGDPRVTRWFELSALGLSLLPLFMIGGFVFWAAKRVRADHRDDDLISPPAPAGLHLARVDPKAP